MVAATTFAATPTAGELALVAQLGSLLQSRAVIERRRWRAYATARLIPVFALYNLPLDRLRDDLRDETGIVCPDPIRPVIATLLDHELERDAPRAAVIARLIEARWKPDWVGALFAVTSAALYAEAHSTLLELPARSGNLAQRLHSLTVTGAIARHGHHGAWGSFHGNLEAVGSEAAFPASPSLILALVETAIRQRGRLDAIETVAGKLGSLDRRRALAHLARAVLVLEGPRAAELRLRSLRDDSVRDAGWYLVAREAIRHGDEEVSSRFAASIANSQLARRARTAIAWHVSRTEPLRARRLLGAGDDFEHWRLRTTIALRLRLTPRVPWWAYNKLPRADALPSWLGEPVVEPWVRVRVIAGAAELRLPDPDHAARAAAIDFGVAARGTHTRREVIEIIDLLGLDPFTTIARMRESAYPDRVQPHDVLFAELIAQRTEAIVKAGAELPRCVRAGIDGDRPPRSAPDATAAELLEPECPPARERRNALAEYRSLDRALYDEGTAWGTPRRLGIVTAARACLADAAADPALVESRARTLALLGGTQPRELLESAVARAGDAPVTLRLLEALCRIDHDAAARSAMARACAPRETDDPLLRDVLSLAELYRGLPRGFARVWCETQRALTARLGIRGTRAFLAELVTLRGIPDPALLAWIATRGDGDTKVWDDISWDINVPVVLAL